MKHELNSAHLALIKWVNQRANNSAHSNTSSVEQLSTLHTKNKVTTKTIQISLKMTPDRKLVFYHRKEHLCRIKVCLHRYHLSKVWWNLQTIRIGMLFLFDKLIYSNVMGVCMHEFLQFAMTCKILKINIVSQYIFQYHDIRCWRHRLQMWMLVSFFPFCWNISNHRHRYICDAEWIWSRCDVPFYR